MNENVPLIWTTKGNVPVESLTLETVWDDQAGYVKFVERYRDERGDIVKESAHVYTRLGVEAETAIATI